MGTDGVKWNGKTDCKENNLRPDVTNSIMGF